MIIKGNEQTENYLGENCYITELLNSPDLSELSVAVARVLPGEETELHALEGHEVYYVLQGKGEVFIDGANRGTLEKGDLALIKKDLSQKITNTGTGDLIFLCICSPRFRTEGYRALE
ncbi:MAG: cupin domain-containing protein [Saprospirales bacterium]|nr:MAG: cupin domain-containing protein [Saprospirales bacterium]